MNLSEPDELGIIPGEAPDDDPDVVAGMERLRALRAVEGSIREILGTQKKPPQDSG